MNYEIESFLPVCRVGFFFKRQSLPDCYLNRRDCRIMSEFKTRLDVSSETDFPEVITVHCQPLHGGTAMLRAFATVVLYPITLVCCALVSADADAQSTDFPYEARVVAEETYARSGAGEAYYPTQRLPRESTVIVHRHDPGGWYSIEPPSGSFSWIPERFVKRLSDSEGEVTEENVAAWVGSEFGDETSVFQRRMKAGEKVTILGQKQLDTTSGLQSMLKVAPPTRERRWIPGAAVVPVDENLRRKQNADPYKVPGNAKLQDGAIVTPGQAKDRTAMNGGGVVDVPLPGPSSQLQNLKSLRQEQQQLAEIDRRFREMILQDASRWDLDSVENQYRSLQTATTHKPISGQIDMRYPAIERYRRRLVSLMEIKDVTTQTEMRDAQLLARHSQNGFGLSNTAVASVGPESTAPQGEPMELAAAFDSFLNRDVSNIAANAQPVPAVTSMTPESLPTSENPPAAQAGVITPGSPQNRFVGAGIVQKAENGEAGAGYVLMAPSGKILADLKPTGNVRLEDFVGQQVGVQGSRWSEKEKRDIIEVSALESVRIRQ